MYVRQCVIDYSEKYVPSEFVSIVFGDLLIAMAAKIVSKNESVELRCLRRRCRELSRGFAASQEMPADEID